ncbi:MAG: hypothetical protein LBJ08_12395, partial [Bifidobacteriaceae bacterium]|nr:hypothetical protein [Bifidobacteriaceae bacterium]
ERRARDLLHRAIRNNEPWLHDLGPTPTVKPDRQRWYQAATTVAAYRDRWGITGPRAIPTRARGNPERLDVPRARTAITGLSSGPPAMLPTGVPIRSTIGIRL